MLTYSPYLEQRNIQGTMWLTSLIIIISITGMNGKDEPYYMKRETNSPGIFFEAQQPLYRVSEKWKLIGYINIQEINEIVEKSIDLSLKRLQELCKEIPLECNEDMLTSWIEYKQREIDQEYVNLNSILFQKIVRDKEYFLRTNREISSNDLEMYNEEIERKMLNKTRPDYVSFIPEFNTVIIESGVREKSEVILLKLHHLEVNFHPSKVTTVMGIKVQNYVQEWANKIEQVANNMFDLVKMAQKIISDVNNNELNAQSMIQPLLRSTIEDIILSRNNNSFPFRIIDLEKLTKRSQIKTGLHKGKFIYCLDFPLVEEKPHELYQIHAHPVYQEINKEVRVYAYVKPETKYIAISPNKRFISTLTQLDINSLFDIGEMYISDIHMNSQSLQGNESCLSKLLTNSRQNTYEHCTLFVKPAESRWELKPLKNVILYSTIHPKNGKITCNEKSNNVTLDGTGVLEIKPWCRIEIENQIFSFGEQIKGAYDDIIPRVNLNLNVLLTKEIKWHSEMSVEKFTELRIVKNKLRKLESVKQSEQEENMRYFKAESYHFKIMLLCVILLNIVISVIAPWNRMHALYRWIKYYDIRKKERQNRSPTTPCEHVEELDTSVEV